VIPFVDLKAQHRGIRSEVDAAVARVLDSCQFVLGPEVQALEEEFADYCGAGCGVGLNSGTSALHLALLAAGIGPGDEVITVSMTFVATTAAVRYVGATPVFVDIDARTYTMDASKVEAAITERTRAILPVHLYGQTADMDAICAVARRHNLLVIEDAAQAHGAELNGRRAGSLADMACFSFYPAKNLGAPGDAGMAVTNNAAYADAMKKMRDWGQGRKYYHDMAGFNFRMGAFQAAILRIKLRRLEEWTEARRAHAAAYDRLLRGCGAVAPAVMPGARHVYHVYPVRVREREAVQAALSAKGIQTGIHYPIPVHLQKAYADPRYPQGSLPVTEAVAAEELSLPMFAELTDEQVQEVAGAVREVCPG
jgi:dTDP-4-amino-4,6-dideoxygalactose transaminase